jgi:hypothetical protein
LKLMIAGLAHGVDQWVVRGDPATRAFSTFGFRDGKLAVVESVKPRRRSRRGEAHHRHDEDADARRSGRPGVRSVGLSEAVDLLVSVEGCPQHTGFPSEKSWPS